MNTFDLKSAALALGGAVSGGRVRCPAPGKSRANRSLSVKLNPDGTFTATDFSGGDWRAARDHVKACLGLSDARPVAFNDNAPSIDLAALKDRTGRALNIWRQSRSLPGTIAAAYLASRGLSYEGDALRFHPSCLFARERHPAMVALMTDAINGEPTGVHRTALLPDGSGKAEPGKMMLGKAQGAVVRLSPDHEVSKGLGIAEGIETALAAPFRPVWACLSAGTMEVFPVLSGIGALTIFADQDKAGIDAANECGERWHDAGVEVTIAAPLKGDFADLQVAA